MHIQFINNMLYHAQLVAQVFFGCTVNNLPGCPLQLMARFGPSPCRRVAAAARHSIFDPSHPLSIRSGEASLQTSGGGNTSDDAGHPSIPERRAMALKRQMNTVAARFETADGSRHVVKAPCRTVQALRVKQRQHLRNRIPIISENRIGQRRLQPDIHRFKSRFFDKAVAPCSEVPLPSC